MIVRNRLDLALSPHPTPTLPSPVQTEFSSAHTAIQRYSVNPALQYVVQRTPPPTGTSTPPPSPVNPTGRWRSETWAWAALARQPRHILSAQSRVSSPLNQPLVCFAPTVQSSPGSSPGRSACVSVPPGGRGRDIWGGGPGDLQCLGL